MDDISEQPYTAQKRLNHPRNDLLRHKDDHNKRRLQHQGDSPLGINEAWPKQRELRDAVVVEIGVNREQT